jgi:hypothetical protein
LAEKRFTPQKKIQKSDPGPALQKRRLAFAKKHAGKDAAAWRSEVQAVADLKDFTYYPRDLRAKFSRVRASWTYMRPEEKHLPAFVRPKKWFPRSQWKRTKKLKIFAMTASNGKSIAFTAPPVWNTAVWAAHLRRYVGPFLKKAFPRRRSYNILLDGEPLLHGAVAKEAVRNLNITVLPNWPKYSPDLNPQENVWTWAEEELRRNEEDGDTFEKFGERVLQAVTAYVGNDNLVGSMARRVARTIAAGGAMTKS